MKILVVTGIFPPDAGGPAGYVPRIAAELAGRGHQVSVLTLSDSLEHDDSGYPFPVRRIGRGGFKPLRALRTTAAVYELSRGADVVLVNGLRSEAVLGARMRGVPTVHKVVGDLAWERARNRGWFRGTLDEYQAAGKGVRLRLLDWMRTAPLRRADRVIVPSRYLQGIVHGWGVAAEPAEIVYNAVEPGGPAGEYPLPPFAGATLVTVCRLVPWKGVDQLVDALAGLPGARLVVVGDGPLRAELEARARAGGVEGRVLFTGSLSHGQVRAVLRQAQVFVLNSSYEGLPHVVLEAMAEGVPVVATDAGGTGEVVRHGETGLLVRVGEPADLQAAVRRVLGEPATAAALREGAARQLSGMFAYPRMVDATERVLAGCARAR